MNIINCVINSTMKVILININCFAVQVISGSMGCTRQRCIFIGVFIFYCSLGNCFKLQHEELRNGRNMDQEDQGLFHGLNPAESLGTQKQFEMVSFFRNVYKSKFKWIFPFTVPSMYVQLYNLLFSSG